MAMWLCEGCGPNRGVRASNPWQPSSGRACLPCRQAMNAQMSSVSPRKKIERRELAQLCARLAGEAVVRGAYTNAVRRGTAGPESELYWPGWVQQHHLQGVCCCVPRWQAGAMWGARLGSAKKNSTVQLMGRCGLCRVHKGPSVRYLWTHMIAWLTLTIRG